MSLEKKEWEIHVGGAWRPFKQENERLLGEPNTVVRFHHNGKKVVTIETSNMEMMVELYARGTILITVPLKYIQIHMTILLNGMKRLENRIL